MAPAIIEKVAASAVPTYDNALTLLLVEPLSEPLVELLWRATLQDRPDKRVFNFDLSEELRFPWAASGTYAAHSLSCPSSARRFSSEPRRPNARTTTNKQPPLFLCPTSNSSLNNSPNHCTRLAKFIFHLHDKPLATDNRDSAAPLPTTAY
jgi:hypothetical protein